jgi:hypothetical protein
MNQLKYSPKCVLDYLAVCLFFGATQVKNLIFYVAIPLLPGACFGRQGVLPALLSGIVILSSIITYEAMEVWVATWGWVFWIPDEIVF